MIKVQLYDNLENYSQAKTEWDFWNRFNCVSSSANPIMISKHIKAKIVDGFRDQGLDLRLFAVRKQEFESKAGKNLL